jgi:hypothetical protein
MIKMGLEEFCALLGVALEFLADKDSWAKVILALGGLGGFTDLGEMGETSLAALVMAEPFWRR